MEGTEVKIIAGVVIGSLVLIGGIALLGSTVGPKDTVDPTTVIGPAHHTKGASSEDAQVAIVEFSDFQCPACKAAFPTIEQIVGEYSNSVRFVYRHFPLLTIHPNAQPAAYASEAAGEQEKFWEAHDWLFENQSTWEEADNVDGEYFYQQFGAELELEKEQFLSDYKKGELRQRVSDDFSAGRGLGVDSTPTFFVNGERVKGGLTVEEWKRIIEDALNTNP